MAEGRKNPHWHLVENGHEIITPFKKNGKKTQKMVVNVLALSQEKRIVSAVLKKLGRKARRTTKKSLTKSKG